MNPKRQFTKTKLMAHQTLALRKGYGRKGFGYLMEQGTGKSLTIIAECLALYAAGKIEGLIVLAPNGVHEGWVLEQLPAHVPDDVNMIAAYYSSAPTRREKRALEALMRPREVGEVPPFRVLTISYDSLLVDRGFKFAEKFARSVKCLITADESQKIKNLDSRRTRRALNLRKHCEYRRISTGTPITNSPLDAFAQFEFLDEGLLGHDSIVAFRADFCELLPESNFLMRHLLDRKARAIGRPLTPLEKEVMAPKIVATDELGRPKYRNLPRLHESIAEHSYRVLKEECLDLPPKTYSTLFFHLSKAQREVYDRMADELRCILEDGTMVTTSKLVAMSKLRQITSGFLLLRDGSTHYVEDNPRIELLHSSVEDITEQGIIWGQYKEELRNVQRMITKDVKATCEIVNGDTPMKRRREIRDEFMKGNLQWIAAHPGTMGSGYTLTAGKVVFYYSNGFNLEERLQSEDRTHRIGTAGTIPYNDLVAIDTRDDDVVWALQHKLDTAAIINGDPERKSRFHERTER